MRQRRKWELFKNFSLSLFFLIPHWWVNMPGSQCRLSIFFSVHLFYSSKCVAGGSYPSLDLCPFSSRLAVAQPSRTTFPGEIKLIDSFMSCNFTCHKFQAPRRKSIVTKQRSFAVGTVKVWRVHKK